MVQASISSDTAALQYRIFDNIPARVLYILYLFNLF